MTHKEALFVVIGVDKPAGDAVGAVAAHFAAVGIKNINAVDLDLDLAVSGGEQGDVRLAEDDKEVAFAGVFKVAGHVQIGVHARLEDRQAPQLTKVSAVRFVGKGAGDQKVKSGIASLTGGFDQIGALDGAKFGANKDGGAPFNAAFAITFQVAPFATDQITGPGFEAGKGDAVCFVRLLHASHTQLFQDHLRKALLHAVGDASLFERLP